MHGGILYGLTRAGAASSYPKLVFGRSAIKGGMKTFITCIGAALVVVAGFGMETSVVVHFKNGDRLSGTLIEESDRSIVLGTQMLGPLRLDREVIEKLNRVGAQEKGAVVSKPSPTPATELAGLDSKTRTAVGISRWLALFQLEAWKQRLEIGMNSQSGRRDKTDFLLRYDMRKKVGKTDHRIQSRVLYGETNKEKSTDKLLTNYRWRHDIAPGVFYESYSSYSFDAIKEIDHNLEQKLGIGYRWVNREGLKFSTGGGSSGRFRDDTTGNAGFFYLVDLFEDIDYRLNKRLRMTQEFRFAVPPENSDLYEYDFRAAVISDITDSLNFTLRYQLEYDNSQPADRREDQRLISAIGMDF